MSRVNWGGLAGGLAAGLEQGQRMRLQREQERLQQARDARDAEMHGYRVAEAQAQQDRRQREEKSWRELAALTREMMGASAPPQVAAPGAAPGAQQPATTEPIDQGNGVQTMPFQDDGGGLPARSLPAQEAPGDAPAAGLQRLSAPTQRAAAPVAAGGPDASADPKSYVGFSVFRNTNLFRDPKYLDRAAQIFLDNGVPEGVKWLERGHMAARENTFEALQAFNSGNPQKGIELFNAGGRYKIEDAQPIAEGPDKGKWMLRVAGVQKPVLLDPKADMRAFLPPDKLFALEDKERDDARADQRVQAEGKVSDARVRLLDAQTDATKRNADSLERYRGTMGAAATTRAERPSGTGGGRGGDPTRARNALSAQIDAQLRLQLRDTAPTNPTKPETKLPNPLSEFIPDIREQIMQDVDAGVDPNVAFNNRYVEWGERFDQANEVLGQAFDKAKRAGSGILNGRSDAVASLRASIEEIAKGGVPLEEQRRYAKASKRDMALFEEAARGMASGRVAAAPRPGSAPAPAAAQEPPKRPTTRAEVEGYPSGTRYINPADGRILVKK